MKALAKLPLLAAIILTSACSTSPKMWTPFDVYMDKDKTFKEMEKLFPEGWTAWEMRYNNDAYPDNSAYERLYTYDNEKFAKAIFGIDKNITNNRVQAYYTVYEHTKTSTEGWTVGYNDKGTIKPADAAGYDIYMLTPIADSFIDTTKPREFQKTTMLIKIEGSKILRHTVSMNTTNKNILLRAGLKPDEFIKR